PGNVPRPRRRPHLQRGTDSLVAVIAHGLPSGRNVVLLATHLPSSCSPTNIDATCWSSIGRWCILASTKSLKASLSASSSRIVSGSQAAIRLALSRVHLFEYATAT